MGTPSPQLSMTDGDDGELQSIGFRASRSWVPRAALFRMWDVSKSKSSPHFIRLLHPLSSVSKHP